MPVITPETPRSLKVIAGIQLRVPEPYAAGREIDETEARVLNQVFAENLGNNLRSTFTKVYNSDDGVFTDPSWDQARAQDELDDKAQTYQWYQRSGGRISMNPVEKKARELATAAVKDALARDGRTADKETVKQLSDNAFEKHRDTFLSKAQALVDAAKQAASEVKIDLAETPLDDEENGDDEDEEEAA